MAGPPNVSQGPGRARAVVTWMGLAGGPVVAAAMYGAMTIVPGVPLPHAARATAALAALMAVWWLTEAIPLSATALLPIPLLPLLGVSSVRNAAAPYADPLIFLFLGGFVLGLAMQKWGLHKRIALRTVLIVGAGPRALIAGFMVATAIMSMWVSNTATAVMMMPIGASVIGLVFSRLGGDAFDPTASRGRPGANFATALMLGIAYAASIGGVGTLIGTPPNLVLATQSRELLGRPIGFGQWMMLGVPLVVLLLPMAWAYLVFVAHPVKLREIPGGKKMIAGELRALGPVSRGELTVMIVFFLTAAAWMFRPLIVEHAGIDLDDTAIAVIAALLLFVIPVDTRRLVFAMDWRTAEKLPWGVLLLFGGGLSLAKAMTDTGLTGAIAESLGGLRGLPPLLPVALVTLVMIFLTELTSNTAVATAFLPILAAAAAALGVDPYLLMVPAAVAASCAFMLPVATPPNAIVFSSGYVTLPQMARAGLVMNLVGALVIALVCRYAALPLLGREAPADPATAARPDR